MKFFANLISHPLSTMLGFVGGCLVWSADALASGTAWTWHGIGAFALSIILGGASQDPGKQQ